MLKGKPVFFSAVLLIFISRTSLAPFTQEPVPSPAAPKPSSAPAPATERNADAAPNAPQGERIALPEGTHLPLILNNGINTRTAKSGDFLYFQTVYPIARNDRVLIPMGTFVRGRLLSSKRPGLIKGRGEFRMVIDQITFPNGYTIALTATPNSVETDGKAGVDPEGTIRGPASTKHDAGIILATTAGGAYVGTVAGAINSGAPGKGAAIGSGAGLLAGLAVMFLTRGPEAELPRGTTIDVVFEHALFLDPAHLPAGDAGRYAPPSIPAAPPEQPRHLRQPLGSSLLRLLAPPRRY